ncbi:dehydrogenase E1 component-domain-containing protein [Dunaliella salina]|uniref:Dehydrogenase E1 component-domain-containing protein n=1 Tax=Dunaliella salina TaxID=3046 RepID=A0ABQ7GLS6_DUNSA|nr:dehydrogenase E1 component-domain-containing protein [Dunaliella salina]|eukprot:KAF5835562.1 dehydrogenase E1 component-domain-containing protein [Dunaliella salina]
MGNIWGCLAPWHRSSLPAGLPHCNTPRSLLQINDSLITTYRDHCHNLTRGGSVFDTMSELFGRATGTTRGIGGSMHMYNKAENFYGGNGIVGSGIPNGAGIAFAHKYRMEPNVCVTMYGDGAANQGQKYEALNLAALWELPCIFVCENNHYGMGTAEWRAAKSSQFFTRGDYIPGIKADGMDVLAVKQVTQFAKQYALDKGPIILELDTYRYHGHSMSDPGSTYRTRDEINVMRQSRDPIDRVKKLLLEAGVPPEDIKKTEKDMKKEVDDAIAEAKKAPEPPLTWMWRNVYANPASCTLRDVGGRYVTPVHDSHYKDLQQIA